MNKKNKIFTYERQLLNCFHSFPESIDWHHILKPIKKEKQFIGYQGQRESF